MRPKKVIEARLQEVTEFLEDNYDEDSRPDAWEYLANECGKQADGTCLHAGSEACEFECPFR